jgi:hypothetical protein
MGLHGWFETLRKWIDGEEDLDAQGGPRPRSKWEDFMVAIAREVEHAMQQEMFTPPGGPTYIPREYIVFLSPPDDADWQGEKREGLQSGLYHVLSERAKELVGTKEFQTRTLTVELRVDAALEAGRFRVQHIWDTSSPKTIVKPRRVDPAGGARAAVDTAVAEGEDEEKTIVRRRPPKDPIFSVLVRRTAAEGEPAAPDIRPFDKEEITIGRGSRQVGVDLTLEGDLEISRKHATLARRPDGSYAITCHGANSIMVDGAREVTTGETADVKPDEPITISTYELRVKAPGAVGLGF